MARPRRLFVEELPVIASTLVLDREAERHAKVLRLETGSELCLFDARGHESDARVARWDRQGLVCEVQPLRTREQPRVRLHLILGVPKAAKLETIVRMGSELGLHAIHLVESDRAVPKLSAESAKLPRLRRIAIEACGQSEQAYAPEISGPMPLLAAASAAPADAARLVFWENSQTPLELASDAREVWAVVGPEGGLCEQEVAALCALGFRSVGLGSAILRVETACVVASALLLDRLGALR
jgi:16S rRNA (uracil1498-N3)-methyltransferase